MKLLKVMNLNEDESSASESDIEDDIAKDLRVDILQDHFFDVDSDDDPDWAADMYVKQMQSKSTSWMLLLI